MQTAINPALAAAMTLEQAAQMGEFSPVTKDGTPTVVGGKLQQMMQPMMQQGMQPSMPGVQNTAQRAGLGGQIQAMQMQEAQKAMMNAAMQQARPPAGIERLNPQMGNFAEGGIVGYAPGGTAASMLNPEQYALEVEMMNAEAEARRAARARRDEAERLAFLETAAPEVAARLKAQQAPVRGGVVDDLVKDQAPPAAAPAAAPPPAAARERESFTPVQALGITAPLFEKQRAEYAKIRTEPLTPEELLAQNQRERQVRRQMLIQSGLDPDYLDKREQQGKALFEQQQALLRERMERERGKDTFLGRMGEALRNFQQLKGQGIGQGLVRSDQALGRRIAAGEATMDELKNLELKAMELDMTRRNALEDARHAIATGDFNRAQQSLTAARNAENDKAKLVGGTFGPQATAAVQERQVAASEAARAESVKARSEQSLDAQLSRSINVLRQTENDIRGKYKDSLERFRTMRLAGELPKAMADEEVRLNNQMNREISQQTANIRNQIRALETQRFGAPIEPEVKLTATMEDIRATAAKRNVPVETVIAQAKAKGYTITGQ